MGRFTRHLSYANIVSVAVLVAASGSAAYAAKARVFTGANIKDSTLSGADVRNGGLESVDVSAQAISSMRGRKGATGDTGENGGRGPKGDTGDSGDMGKRANSLVRHAYYTSSFLRTNDAAVPNATAKNWDASDYPAYGGAATLPNFADSFPDEDFPTAINANEPVVLQLTGNNQGTTGTIRPTSEGLLSATATLTILHEAHGETQHAGGLALHGRLRCQLRFADNGEPLNAGSPKLGAAEWISSRRRHKIYTITITGSEKINADVNSNYNVGVSCADVDRTSSDQWWFVTGNIAAHAVYVGP